MDIISANSQKPLVSEDGAAQEVPALVPSTQQAKGLLRAFIALRHRNISNDNMYSHNDI